MQNESITKEYVESRLSEWGEWCKKTGIPSLGYKSNSNIASILGVNVQSSGAESFENSSAEEMEKLLLSLKCEYPNEAKAIIMFYSTNHDKTYIARKQKTSIRTLQRRILAGKEYLASKLIGAAHV